MQRPDRSLSVRRAFGVLLRVAPVTLLALIMGAPFGAMAQLVVSQAQTPTQLVQNVLLGPGVFASNVTHNGVPGNAYPTGGYDQHRMGRFNGISSNIGLAGGLIMVTADIDNAIGPNDDDGFLGGGGSVPFGGDADADIAQLSGNPFWQTSPNTYDISKLEFDFIPMSDMVKFRYVFASEEYQGFECTPYNDAFGFFLSGPDISGPYSNNSINLALVPGSLSRVAINSINSGQLGPFGGGGNWPGPDPPPAPYTWDTYPYRYCIGTDPNWQANTSLYIFNGYGDNIFPPYCCDPQNVQFNGFTVVLEASAAVKCGQQYHIKLAIGDVGDWKYNSGVFLEQGSFTSSDRFGLKVRPGPNVQTSATDTTFIESACDSVYLEFHRYGGYYMNEDVQVTTGGAATAGTDYAPPLPTQIHFDPLDTMVVVPIAVPVDADGPEDLVVTIVTCDGLKQQVYAFTIDQKPPLATALDDVTGTCGGNYVLDPQVTGGTGTYTYSWSTGETTPTITVAPVVTTWYYVTVRDSCWTFDVKDSALVTMPVYDPLTLVMSPDTAIPCLSTADIFVVPSGGNGVYTYEWTLSGVEQGTNDSLEVPASVTPVYYVVEVTEGCGRVRSDSVLVSQAPPVPLSITMSPDVEIPCGAQDDISVTVQGGGGVISYAWTQGLNAAGNTATITVPAGNNVVYQVQVNDQCGQQRTGEVEVTVGPTPPLLIHAEGDTVLCAGDLMVLNVISVSGGGGAYSYLWNVPSGSTPNDQSSLQVQVNNDAFFTVTVHDECGNSADTTLAAVVTDHAPLVITVSNDTAVCPGEPVLFAVAVQGGAGGNVIDWNGLGGSPTLSWTAGHASQEIQVSVTDQCGESESAAIDVTVYPAWALINAHEIYDGTWMFRAETDPPVGNSLEWDLGDGSSATTVDVTHTYTDNEAHWVVLQIVTPNGCIAVDSMRTRPPVATIFFPNTFTPDADGINDTFGGEGRLIDDYVLYIFDRWGAVIFESHNMADRWDGTVKGHAPVTGIYNYKYRVTGVRIVAQEGVGHVNLLK